MENLMRCNHKISYLLWIFKNSQRSHGKRLLKSSIIKEHPFSWHLLVQNQ